MPCSDSPHPLRMTRRSALRLLGGAALALPLAHQTFAAASYTLSPAEEDFLEELQRGACKYFWEQASPTSGQVLDRARAQGTGGRDPRRLASIAATGFGLTALCIADTRGYVPHAALLDRVRTTLRFHWAHLPQKHGFYYHFSDLDTGKTAPNAELSSIDTSLLLCGILTCRAHFHDDEVQDLASKIYERVDWPWMLNGSRTFSMGWLPRKHFISAQWNTYSEEMMLYLLAIGSPTHPVSPEYWTHFQRPVIEYEGFRYISTRAPLFIHQYSHAWFDFRHQRDAFADYFANSIVATRAHKAFCLSMPARYNEDLWGITSSDYIQGYTAWGGPPTMGPIDGSVVPAAAAGSLVFLPTDCLHVLMAMKQKYGNAAWGQYGFVDAFNPGLPWYDNDVLGIDQGISLLMAENLRTGFVWNTFMRNQEAAEAMRRCGFHAT